MKAFIDNDNIFITSDETIIPQGATTLEVPEGTTPLDLVIDNGQLRFKNEQEKLAEQKEKEKQEALQKLTETDTEMERITEDLIDTLIANKVIDIQELPQVVTDKINERKSLREKLK